MGEGIKGRRTLHLRVNPGEATAEHPAIRQAAAILQAGGLVAFATETVYGLGAHALDPLAGGKIFEAKQRPAWDPLIVHIAEGSMAADLTTELPEPARRWMEAFWPGPLTLLLPRSRAVPDEVTAGRPRVGLRVPRHPVAQAVLRACGLPIAAPSANLFSHVSPSTAEHVLADLEGRIDAVLDGGPTEHGVESTVVDACEDPCLLYRPGAVTLEQLQAVWPRVVAAEQAGDRDSREPSSLASPGLGMRHYAPRAELVLIEHGIEHGSEQAAALLAAALGISPERVGVLLPSGLLSAAQEVSLPGTLVIYPWGAWGSREELAHRLFSGLRSLDAAGVERILCPLPADEGLGRALCDRLRKAARPARG